MACPIACIKCVLPSPTPPYRKSGLYDFDGCSATACAAACANWLLLPTTNVSNVYRGFSWWFEESKSSFACAGGGAAAAGVDSVSAQTNSSRLPDMPNSASTASKKSPYVWVSRLRKIGVGTRTTSRSVASDSSRVGPNQVEKLWAFTRRFMCSSTLSQEFTVAINLAEFPHPWKSCGKQSHDTVLRFRTGDRYRISLFLHGLPAEG